MPKGRPKGLPYFFVRKDIAGAMFLCIAHTKRQRRCGTKVGIERGATGVALHVPMRCHSRGTFYFTPPHPTPALALGVGYTERHRSRDANAHAPLKGGPKCLLIPPLIPAILRGFGLS
jgi:hypothetical protein